jgi:ketopantoate reductase
VDEARHQHPAERHLRGDWIRTDAIVADQLTRRVALLLGKETVAVGLELGIDFYRDYLAGEPEAYLQGFDDVRMQEVERRFADAHRNVPARSSLMQDIERGRPTEIDYLNGYVVEKGRAVGVPTPANEAIVRLTKRVERHGRGPIDETRAELEAVYAALV